MYNLFCLNQKDKTQIQTDLLLAAQHGLPSKEMPQLATFSQDIFETNMWPGSAILLKRSHGKKK